MRAVALVSHCVFCAAVSEASSLACSVFAAARMAASRSAAVLPLLVATVASVLPLWRAVRSSACVTPRKVAAVASWSAGPPLAPRPPGPPIGPSSTLPASMRALAASAWAWVMVPALRSVATRSLAVATSAALRSAAVMLSLPASAVMTAACWSSLVVLALAEEPAAARAEPVPMPARATAVTAASVVLLNFMTVSFVRLLGGVNVLSPLSAGDLSRL